MADKISLDKKYRTRCGLPARVYAVDGVGLQEVHGAIKTEYGWESHTWGEFGNFLVSQVFKSRHDLVPFDAPQEEVE